MLTITWDVLLYIDLWKMKVRTTFVKTCTKNYCQNLRIWSSSTLLYPITLFWLSVARRSPLYLILDSTLTKSKHRGGSPWRLFRSLNLVYQSRSNADKFGMKNIPRTKSICNLARKNSHTCNQILPWIKK